MAHLWARTEDGIRKWLIYGHGQKTEYVNGIFLRFFMKLSKIDIFLIIFLNHYK